MSARSFVAAYTAVRQRLSGLANAAPNVSVHHGVAHYFNKCICCKR